MRDRLSVLGLLRLGMASVMALGLVLQLVVLPAGAFAGPVDPLWALGGICHAPGESGGGPQPLSDHDHQHCPLCQCGTVAFLVPESAPLLRQGVAVLLRRAPPVLSAPRGALWLAYASRAPPVPV